MRLRRLSLLAISIFALLLSIISPVISSMPVQADSSCAAGGNYRPGGSGDCTPTNEVKSYAYYVALGDCVQYNMNKSFSVSAELDGAAPPAKDTWFNDNNAYAYIFPGAAKTDCWDIANAALAFWGWGSDYQNFLESIGYSYDNGAQSGQARYSSQSDGQALRDKFEASVSRKVYGGSNVTPKLSDAARYALAYEAFMRNGGPCKTKDLGAYPELKGNDTYKDWVDEGTISSSSEIGGLVSTRGSTKFTKLNIFVSNADPAKIKLEPHGFAYLISETTTTATIGGGAPMPSTVSSSLTEAVLYGYHAFSTLFNGSHEPVSMTCEALAGEIQDTGTKYLAWAEENAEKAQEEFLVTLCPNGANRNEDGSCPEEPTPVACAIDAVGWLVCPVVNFLAGLADGAFGTISDQLLRTDVKLVDTSQPTYNIWAVMRSFANIAFVIIFLVIIFSQLTGLGVTNYGVKKMLPRLVIATLLVNVSFFLCQIAVDLSNILGYTLNDTLRGIGADVLLQNTASNGVSDFATDGLFTGMATGILAVGSVVLIYALLSTFIPIIVAAIAALVMIVFILIARQALVVILIVLSPIAFVAFLLPNTEKYFTQWRKMFIALLLVFPLTSLVFGLSSLTSNILSITFSGDLSGADENNWFGQIVAAAVLVLPLFIVPVLLKKSLDGIPKIGELANKWGTRANKSLGSKINESYKGSLVGRGRAIRKGAKESYRTAKYADRVNRNKFNKLLSSNPVPVLPVERHANKALGATAANIADEALAKDIKNENKALERAQPPVLRSFATGKGTRDFAKQAAAIQRVVASNDIRGMSQIWDASKSWTGPDGDKLRSVLADSLEASSGRPVYYGAGAIAKVRSNDHDMHKKTLLDAVSAGAYSPTKIAGADKDELAEVGNVVKDESTQNVAYRPAHQQLINDAYTALTDSELSRTLGKNRDDVDRIRGNNPRPPLA